MNNIKCVECQGSGKVLLAGYAVPETCSWHDEEEVDCPFCIGVGEIEMPDHDCRATAEEGCDICYQFAIKNNLPIE